MERVGRRQLARRAARVDSEHGGGVRVGTVGDHRTTGQRQRRHDRAEQTVLSLNTNEQTSQATPQRRRDTGRMCKGKKRNSIYIALLRKHRLKALRHGSHSFTCKLHHACFSFVSVHQMAPPITEVADIQLQLTTHLSIQRGERLSWPGWLTYSGRYTHIRCHPSATGRAQDRESSPAKDRRSTAVPRNQPYVYIRRYLTVVNSG